MNFFSICIQHLSVSAVGLHLWCLQYFFFITIQKVLRLLTETVYYFLDFNILHNFLVMQMIAVSHKKDVYDVSCFRVTPHLMTLRNFHFLQITWTQHVRHRVTECMVNIRTLDLVMWDRFKLKGLGGGVIFVCCWKFNTSVLYCSTTATSAMGPRNACCRWEECCVQLLAVERVCFLNQEWRKLYVNQAME